jgi:hypothetical protein
MIGQAGQGRLGRVDKTGPGGQSRWDTGMIGQEGQGRLGRVDKTGLAGQSRWDTTDMTGDRAGWVGETRQDWRGKAGGTLQVG